jgi:hypothetical protein
MIYYLVTPEYTHTMRTFLDHWAGNVQERIRIVTYDEAFRARELPVGTYIFADLERMLPAETEAATLVWNQLHAAGARLLNHPTRTLRRYDLLTMLHARGRNRFRVARATDAAAELGFPVFVREEADHRGSITKLLENRHQLDDALSGAMVRGHRLKNLLVEEYCDTSDAHGVFRKHSAFVVGGRVVPCHVDCSRGWVVKDTDLVSPEVMEEERRYVETNPHRQWLEETFALAGVDYGRVDYSLLGDAPQVWEINTNPIVILHPDNYSEIHMPVKRLFAEQIRPAFEAIDTVAPGRTVTLAVPPLLLSRLDKESNARRRAQSRHLWIRRITRSAPFKLVRAVARPFLTALSPLIARMGRGQGAAKSN